MKNMTVCSASHAHYSYCENCRHLFLLFSTHTKTHLLECIKNSNLVTNKLFSALLFIYLFLLHNRNWLGHSCELEGG